MGRIDTRSGGKERFSFSVVVVLTASHAGGADKKHRTEGDIQRSGLHFRARKRSWRFRKRGLARRWGPRKKARGFLKVLRLTEKMPEQLVHMSKEAVTL